MHLDGVLAPVVLELADLLRRRVPAPELLGARFGEPHRAVRRRHRGMDQRRAGMRDAKLLDLAARRIEARDPVRHPVLRDPEIAVGVGMRGPGETIGPGHFEIDIDDVERLVVDLRRGVAIGRELGRRFRQHRGFPEHVVEIGHDLVGLGVAEAGAVGERGAHRLAHELDARAPAVLVGGDRRHLRLEAVAAQAIVEQRLLAARLRQELQALQDGQIAPAHRRALQRKVVRRGAVGRERDAAPGLGLGAERAHAQAIFARRQVLHRVAAGIVGEHAHGHLELAVARLHERGAQRRAIRPGDRAGYAGGVGGRRDDDAATTTETSDAAMDATTPARTIDRAAALKPNDRMAFPRVCFV